MAFRERAVSYARFRVRGGPEAVNPGLVDALGEAVLTPPPVGAPPEMQSGWVAGRHVLDTAFDLDAVLFGEQLLFGMRLDVNRVPAEIRRAYREIAMFGTGNGHGNGHTNGNGRGPGSAVEIVDERCRQELAAGLHRRSRMVPVLWDVPRRLILAPAMTDMVRAALSDLLADTFGATLDPLTAGAIAHERLAKKGRTRDYEDLAPSPFTAPPAAAEADDDRALRVPSVPWSPPGAGHDFLGNEFLIWLWSRTETGQAVISTDAGEVAIAMDRALDMDCAWSVTGKQRLRADAPTRLPEAAAALALGKWPRRVGLIVAACGEEWSLDLQADRFVVTGAQLPGPDPPPATPREMTEHRLASVTALDRALVALYATFLEARVGDSWPTEREAVASWIKKRKRPPAARGQELINEPSSAPGPDGKR